MCQPPFLPPWFGWAIPCEALKSRGTLLSFMSDDETPRCGSTETKNGEPCGRAAGWGTDHKGEGFCTDHESDGPRPYAMDESTRDGIVDMLRRGHSISTATESFGVNRSTYYRWLKLAEDNPDSVYADFADEVMRARAAGREFFERRFQELVNEKTDPRSWLKYMTLLYPDSYGDSRLDDKDETTIVLKSYSDSDTSENRVDLDEDTKEAE